MASIDINGGNPVLTLSGAAILTSTTYGSSFHAGSCAVVGLHLWALITVRNGGNITSVTFKVETSNDNSFWAPTLATLHQGAGSTDVAPAVTGLAANATVLRHIHVEPKWLGSAKYVRLGAHADQAGQSGDALQVWGTGW